MADWLGGYSAGWDAYEVDPETWAASSPIGGMSAVEVVRDGTDDVPLIETGTMEFDGEPPFEWAWLCICMSAEQDGAERIPIATLLFERASTATDHQSPKSTMRGYSVLKPAADRRLARGAFAPAGCDGAQYAAMLLRACTPAPVVVEGSFTLSEDVVFDLGSTYLAAAWMVLRAADWCIQIDGEGVIYIRQKPAEPALELDRAHAGLLIPGVDCTLDLSEVPNRYIAVRDGETAIAANEDAELLASRPRRDRWVDMVDTSPVPVNGEDLLAYAQRRLAEESTVMREYSYQREFWPGVTPFSLVRASLAVHGVEGDLRVLKQTLACGKGIVISETSGEEVRV